MAAPSLLQASLGAASLFGVLLALAVFRPRALQLWTRKHGRAHRLLGLAELLLLAAGLVDVAAWETGRSVPRRLLRLLYDVLLGVCGTALTLSAAAAFSHANVKNQASGVLEEEATITQDEMIEHAFYQLLNLLQAGYLHCLPAVRGPAARAALCLFISSPWLVRDRFPVNSFSRNYVTSPKAWWTLINLLYRVKKWQYVAYKHVLLFGLNASLALSPARDCLPQTSRSFRLYWVLLNAAYVLECVCHRRWTIRSTILTRPLPSFLADAGEATCAVSERDAGAEPAAHAGGLAGRDASAASGEPAARTAQLGPQLCTKKKRLQQSGARPARQRSRRFAGSAGACTVTPRKM